MTNIGAKLISLQGNIGSGKSTLLRFLKQRISGVQIIPEPVKEWQTSNLLHLYYADPKRWAFTFQTYALFSRLKHLRDSYSALGKSCAFMVSQRSIEADSEVFAKLLYRKGYFNETEYLLYRTEFEGFRDLLQLKKVDKFVYLRVPPELCLKRLTQRNRIQETDKIPLQYLTQLHNQHEEWLAGVPNKIVIDGTPEFETDEKMLNEMVTQIVDELSASN